MSLLLALVLALGAAPKVEPACWFTPEPLTLHASGLPTRDTFAVTFVFHPEGTLLRSVDGTYEAVLPNAAPPITAYFWQRGGGPSLAKPGAQLNDYKLIATCSA